MGPALTEPAGQKGKTGWKLIFTYDSEKFYDSCSEEGSSAEPQQRAEGSCLKNWEPELRSEV